MNQPQDTWGTRIGLVLAMAGNAVGFGNFLRFPVQAMQHGGGSFLIPYLVCFFLMGIPLLLSEWAMGRWGGRFGYHHTPFIMGSLGQSPFWKYFGMFGLFINIAVAAYYCYIESWTLAYLWNSVQGTFMGKTPDQVARFFDDYVALGSVQPWFFWIFCVGINVFFLARGLRQGIERVALIGMPLLFLFGLLLAIRGVSLKAGEMGAIYPGTVGLNYLWTPDFSSIWRPEVWLAAAGQIFFTLSVGMGAVQCYASFVRANDDIALNAMSAGWMNEFVEVCLGGAIVIPITVGYVGIEGMQALLAKAGGIGLGFRTLPYLFTQWGPVLGLVGGVMWFSLLFFAGITSSLAMGAPLVRLLEESFQLKRTMAAACFGLIVLLLGVPIILGFNQGVFDEFDYWTGTVALVVFAFIESLLFAWIFGINRGWAEINRGAEIVVPRVFKFLLKYVTPLILLAILGTSMPEIYAKVTHAALYKELAQTTDAAEAASIRAVIHYRNLARLLLLGLLLGLMALLGWILRRQAATPARSATE